MTTWRMELTVLTDLSASIFAVCFMILLVFIGLAEKEQAIDPAPETPIEATTALALVRRQPLRPAEMVDLLDRHGESARPEPVASSGIDLFADRIEVRRSDRPLPVVLPRDAIAQSLAEVVAQGSDAEPLRLYVFANTLYRDVSSVLARSGIDWVEMSVPRFLRDPARPFEAWSPDFYQLDAEPLDAAAFRERLADLLAGSVEASAPANGSSADVAQQRRPPGPPPGLTDSLSARWQEFLRRLSILVPVAGLVLVVAIRFRHPDLGTRSFEQGDDRLG